MKNGDWVRFEFTGRLARDSKAFETTSAELARKENIFDEKRHYAPAFAILGEGTLIPGLEEQLLQMNVGEERHFELEPEKAFGRKDPGLVRVMPLGEFRKRDLNPYVGMVLDVDGKNALVRSINSGRVLVDFNHALAGEKLVYDVKVISSPSAPKEKAGALLDYHGLTADVKFDGDALDVTFAENFVKDMQYIVSKTDFIAGVVQKVPEIKRMRVHEEYAKLDALREENKNREKENTEPKKS